MNFAEIQPSQRQVVGEIDCCREERTIGNRLVPEMKGLLRLAMYDRLDVIKLGEKLTSCMWSCRGLLDGRGMVRGFVLGY